MRPATNPHRALQLALALALVASSAGCSSEYWVDFTYVSDAAPSVLVDSDRIEIPAGLAVGVTATPVEDGERTGLALDMVPVRPGIIGIDQALEERQWVIYGISAGATSIELWFAGELVGEMPAVVTEQHAPAD